MAHDRRQYPAHVAEDASWPADAHEHPALAIDGEFYAIGYPESADRQDLSRFAAPPSHARSPSPEPAYLHLRDSHYGEELHAVDRRSRSLSPEHHSVRNVPSSFPPADQGGLRPDFVYQSRSLPASPRSTVIANAPLTSSRPPVGPFAMSPPVTSPRPPVGPFAMSPPVTSPMPPVGPLAMSRPMDPIGNPSPQVRASEGVHLTEKIAPNGEALRKPRRRSVDSAPAYTPSPGVENAKGNFSHNHKSLRRYGNVQRSMSMRGSKPRVMKVRMVNKTDSKSYFAVERTMYQWFYISTAILGNSLTFYAVAHPDLSIVKLAELSATLLSLLSLIVMYYAAIYAYRRRKALSRQSEAAAFDDQFGPVAIVAIIIVVFTVYQGLSLRNIILDMNGQSFGPKATNPIA